MNWKNKEEVREYQRVYRENNKEKLKLYFKKRRSDPANKKRLLDMQRNWHARNKEKMRAYNKEYKEKNKKKLLAQSRERYKTNPQEKLSVILRTRLRRAIKKNNHGGSAIRDLGCTVEELKQHLERQFLEGMTWDNWSFYGWHLDHIKPLCSFDLQDRNQFLEAVHYSNLQPLWAHDNLTKHGKL